MFRRRETNPTLTPEAYIVGAMTGVSGLLLTVSWFWIILKRHPEFLTQLAAFVGLVASVYLAAAIGSILHSVRRRITRHAAKLDSYALSIHAVYGVASAALVWMTGGAESLFLPFLVMTFVLALFCTRAVIGFVEVLIYFLVVCATACYAAWYLPLPVDFTAWHRVLDAPAQLVLRGPFILLSLILPSVGAATVVWLNRRSGKLR